MPGRDSLRRQDRHRAAATGRQLGSPALPRSRAGRRPPPGPDRPCSPPSLALCRASLSWHVPGPHIRNWTRAYGLSRSNKPLPMKQQVPRRPSDMQRTRGTALLPPTRTVTSAPWHGSPLPGSPPRQLPAAALVPSHGRKTETHAGH